jgi:hypothetical protein
LKQLLLLNDKKLDIVTEVNLDNKNYSRDLFKKSRESRQLQKVQPRELTTSCGKLYPTAGKMLKGIEKILMEYILMVCIKRDDKDVIVKS